MTKTETVNVEPTTDWRTFYRIKVQRGRWMLVQKKDGSTRTIWADR